VLRRVARLGETSTTGDGPVTLEVADPHVHSDALDGVSPAT
jgi:hypothetical protein